MSFQFIILPGKSKEAAKRIFSYDFYAIAQKLFLPW